ncbi:ATP-dependent DNA helicase PIF1-like [Acyrthosiphon pisum]|uniref:ATP-dependent DNA helicase n=1 Tax=Acyrthosiphon pisum TaxID=7029 RepID=A0A8R2NLS8_ACYPI|nr:ATP-dependent DNA helicase PIF1-like [Acyrthosiphon pisum]
MPPKKSNLNNAYSNEARRKRVVRHHESAEEIVAGNAAQRIRAAQSRAQESESPIPIKRLQFPIRLAFAMTINKAQGQTMYICGLDLENPCFSHGQLYVACSRVGEPSSLFILAKDRLTKNIVHQLVLS